MTFQSQKVYQADMNFIDTLISTRSAGVSLFRGVGIGNYKGGRRHLLLSFVLVLSTIVLSTSRVSSAHAQTSESSGEPFSGGTSLVLSGAGTGVGLGLIALAFQTESDGLLWSGVAVSVLGPNAGHFYTRDFKRVLLHSALRGVGGFMVIWGAASAFTDSSSSNNGLLVLGGLGLYVGSTIYSIWDAPSSAIRANERHQMMVTPAPVIGPDRSVGMGLMLGASF